MSDDIRTCKATNKQGRPCRAAAGDRDYCYFHANPGMAAQVGRMGGRQNRHVIEGHVTPLPPLNSISGIQGGIAQTIEDLRTSRLPARTDVALANLLSVQLRTFSAGNLEEKIKRLEEKVNALNPDKSTDKAGEN